MSKNNNLDFVYKEEILERSINPGFSSELSKVDKFISGLNPFCGDEVKIQLLIKNNFICKVGIQAIGCKINIASASILSETIINKPVKKITELENLFVEYLNNTSTKETYSELEHLLKLSQIKNFPIRIKCILLSWSALNEAIGNN